ncbi:MAG: hypothetical protein A2096_01095 [Spirochaetes bacterium GWF1_41_5]|nr:MAG: hypothetical protein A2096_01095 [Spirochaetes bacterium GWF1_41_5]HBE03154.1 hypothetical protein [Spirochaetia bacterium]
MKNFFWLLPVIFIAACAGTSGSVSTLGMANKDQYIETDTKPNESFTKAQIKSISVLRFDAKSVKTFRGEIVDYIELSHNFTDDLIRAFYEKSKIRVAAGEYPESSEERDTIERRIGDVDMKTSKLESAVFYKSSPFRKIDAVLQGRILKYQANRQQENSFIEVYLKLSDTYDGSIYWITRIRGFYSDVIATVMLTINNSAYTEPEKSASTETAAPEDSGKIEN